MTELLIDPARRSGCQDLEKFEELVEGAAQRQRSPIDELLDANLVNEEAYMRELAESLGMEWLDSIPQPEAPLPLREACGPRVALRYRLLPVELVGGEEQPRL